MTAEERGVAVKVDSVSKVFRLPIEKNTSIKSMVVNSYKRQRGYDLQRALNKISLDIYRGEFFGIVGRNGSGKSTLLKLLAGIYTPTKGAVHIGGSLTPFIELGVGFNPELTGRENVYLNGALLGFNRKEMRIMYDDIVEFAGLSRFMDQKLKNYSSGMQVRLAFSIAIRAKSDILLVDEVLAVGDTAFQRKCFEHFDKLKEERKTVILVTHDMSAVEKYCDRAMLLNNGKVISVGEPRDISAQYKLLNLESEPEKQDTPTSASAVSLKAVRVNSKKNLILDEDNKNLAIDITFVPRKTQDYIVSISIYRDDNTHIAYYDTSQEPHPITGTADKPVSVRCEFSPKQFLAGAYKIDIEFSGQKDGSFTRELNQVRFVVTKKNLSKGGLINLEAKWSLG